MLVGLTPAVGIGAGLFTTKTAFAQTAIDMVNSGLYKAERGTLKGAIADWTKAIEYNPDDDRAYNNRGNIKEILKDCQGEMSDYTKAIEIDPNYTSYYYNRGNSNRGLGDLKGACTD